MANVNVTSYQFYKAGANETGQLVGYSGGNRVIRYTFKAPAEGANALSFVKKNVGDEQGAVTAGATLRWFVTTDPDGYKNAGPSNEYHGEVTMSDKDGLQYTVKGSADNLILLPNETYYLFIFPGTSKKYYYMWNYPGTITLTLSGAAGLAKIYTGAAYVNAIPYIYTGSEWKPAIPYVHNGSGWKVCS